MNTLADLPDLCEWIWPSDQPTRTDDTFRQHRCGQNARHVDRHTCRYCGRQATGVTR